MGMFLNSIAPYEKYKKISESRYFVDKTGLLGSLIDEFDMNTQYICITRPRRFGKTIAANMIAAFFGKTFDSREIFGDLEVGRCTLYKKYLNQYDVIYIDFSRTSRECNDYQDYIGRIQDGLLHDLMEEYPDIEFDADMAVWDAVFHMKMISGKDKESFLVFLCI